MQGNVLLRNQAGANARAQVLVEKTGNLAWRNVPTALGEAFGKYGDGVCVCLYELCEDLGETNLIFECGQGILRGFGAGPGGVAIIEPREEGRQGLLVVVVDFGDIAVGDDNVGQVAQGLNTVGEADGQEAKCEAGRG